MARRSIRPGNTESVILRLNEGHQSRALFMHGASGQQTFAVMR
jgi:hypothetical protein